MIYWSRREGGNNAFVRFWFKRRKKIILSYQKKDITCEHLRSLSLQRGSTNACMLEISYFKHETTGVNVLQMVFFVADSFPFFARYLITFYCIVLLL